MFDLLKIWITKGNTVERETGFKQLNLDMFEKNLSRINQLDFKIRHALSKSLTIRHLDTGSCNAEEAELIALSNPIYDISRFGIEFTASPRHADVLAVTGPVTRHLKIAMERTYKATPDPKIIIAIGDGACYGTPYDKTYACLGRVDQFIPVDLYIPGNPPTPEDILQSFINCKVLLAQKKGEEKWIRKMGY